MTNYTCELCSFPCSECEGLTDNCTICVNGFIFEDNECLDTCGNGDVLQHGDCDWEFGVEDDGCTDQCEV